jgi:pimeloyl-ACP methyl ester carboxylesterase
MSMFRRDRIATFAGLALTAIVGATAIAAGSSVRSKGAAPMSTPTRTARVPVNGVELYYEIHGVGSPLVLLHGGVNPSDTFGTALTEMAKDRQVFAVHLRGHGFSTDTNEPWSYEQMADDVVALLGKIGVAKVDFMGWSLGAGVALQTAIRHPEIVGRLISISMPFKADGYYPEIRSQFETMPSQAPEFAREIEGSPLATMYPEIDWEVMMRKTGEMNQPNHDWTAGVARIKAPTLLIFSDADCIQLEHMTAFYKLLGGGQRDAGLDGSLRSPNQLAIIPSTTHYNLLTTARSATDYARAFLAQ